MKDYKDELVPMNHPAMPRNFQIFGCYARVKMAIAEFCSLKALTIPQILDILDRGLRRKEVFRNEYYLCGAGENWLIDEAFKALNNPRKGAQSGYRPGHENTVQWEYCDLEWFCKSDNPDATEHHTLAGKGLVELWDPYKPTPRYAPNKIKIVAKRYYRTWPIGEVKHEA